MSAEEGNKIYRLSRDHRPTDDIEAVRIIENGGRIYQTQTTANLPGPGGAPMRKHCILGPHRVFPGRLSVCRTFGDIEAKDANRNGNPNVVIADPDIVSFETKPNEYDFILLGCDGIFDKMSN